MNWLKCFILSGLVGSTITKATADGVAIVRRQSTTQDIPADIASWRLEPAVTLGEISLPRISFVPDRRSVLSCGR